ncbi:hypothetical protein MAB47J26_09072 [Mycobacteroides abscessus 47J26]|nr:hypothetical protein MAB47J26_09072 [Mycobacteroides abscessus 47J26]
MPLSVVDASSTTARTARLGFSLTAGNANSDLLKPVFIMLDGQPLGEYPELSPLQWPHGAVGIWRENRSELFSVLGPYFYGERFYDCGPYR